MTLPRMIARTVALALATTLSFPAPSAAQETRDADAAPASAAAAAMPSAAAASASADAIRPGDIVRVRIWRETDLSGDFPVNESGIVTLPKLGEVSVRGRSPSALVSEIRAAYSESIAHNSIDVVFLRRVQVIGAVRTPGLYHADPTMRVGDVLALAGGANPQGKPNTIELFRDGTRVPGGLSSSTLVGESPIRSGDQIVVPERSWMSRNPGVVVAGIGSALSVSIALIRLLAFQR